MQGQGGTSANTTPHFPSCAPESCVWIDAEGDPPVAADGERRFMRSRWAVKCTPVLVYSCCMEGVDCQPLLFHPGKTSTQSRLQGCFFSVSNACSKPRATLSMGSRSKIARWRLEATKIGWDRTVFGSPPRDRSRCKAGLLVGAQACMDNVRRGDRLSTVGISHPRTQPIRARIRVGDRAFKNGRQHTPLTSPRAWAVLAVP